MSDLFRSDEMSNQYRAYRDAGGLNECVLCTKPSLREFTYWRILKNDFPYDLVAKQHDMIVPKRHITEDFLTEEEKAEFSSIKKADIQDYDFILEPSTKGKSIPQHFHLHLIVIKDSL